jgi:hypothetical protein
MRTWFFEIRLTVVRLQREAVLADDSPATPSFAGHPRREDPRDVVGADGACAGAVLQSNRDKNFEQALGAVVAEVQRMAGPGAHEELARVFGSSC